MGELGVNRDSDEFTSDFSKLLSLVVEGDDLSGADEGEIKRIEEKDYVLAMVGLDVDIDEVTIVPGWCNEARSLLAD